jgi:hypothetical protein
VAEIEPRSIKTKLRMIKIEVNLFLRKDLMKLFFSDSLQILRTIFCRCPKKAVAPRITRKRLSTENSLEISDSERMFRIILSFSPPRELESSPRNSRVVCWSRRTPERKIISEKRGIIEIKA